MVPDAERDGRAVWARERDARVTRVGRILRAAHIDELPQFINILKNASPKNRAQSFGQTTWRLDDQTP